MVYPANVINIMIVSPGDVGEERDLVQDKISIWNSKHSEEYGLILKPLRWEIDSYPGVGKAQSLINSQVVNKSDMAIAIFWSKLGTPTDNHPSGSVEELEAHIEDGKPAMVFFSKANLPNDIDTTQVDNLRSFKSTISNRCFYSEYENMTDLSEQLDRHLHNSMKKHFGPYAKPDQIDKTTNDYDITPESLKLLRQIAESRTECMMVGSNLNEYSVSIDGVDLITDGGSRVAAKIKAQISELESNGFLESIEGKGSAYELTDNGFSLIDEADIKEPGQLKLSDVSEDELKLLNKFVSHNPARVLSSTKMIKLHVGDGWEVFERENLYFFQKELEGLLSKGLISKSTEKKENVEVYFDLETFYEVTGIGYELNRENIRKERW